MSDHNSGDIWKITWNSPGLNFCKGGPVANPGKQREAVLRLHACDYTRLNSAPSLSVVLNLPVLEVCCRPQHPVKEYRLVVIGSVTTEGTRQQMPNIKKNASGVEMSCEQLGSTTEHLRGVIDSLSMLLKARGSFRLCWGVFFFFLVGFFLPCSCLQPQFPKLFY